MCGPVAQRALGATGRLDLLCGPPVARRRLAALPDGGGAILRALVAMDLAEIRMLCRASGASDCTVTRRADEKRESAASGARRRDAMSGARARHLGQIERKPATYISRFPVSSRAGGDASARTGRRRGRASRRDDGAETGPTPQDKRRRGKQKCNELRAWPTFARRR